ncbi:hypothetical protein [Actinoplanes subglobosus]|uniref:Uncharacterized protein n=1 Tax=Actinoplanes subglobosus TaxID=1547892 RepID=A0ABV8INV4_9ACTN
MTDVKAFRRGCYEAARRTGGELPDLAAALKTMPGFRLLTGKELDGPIDVAKWPRISQRDLRYRRPRTLGEGLFNYWD